MAKSAEGIRQKDRARKVSSMQNHPKDGETGVTYHFDKADGRFGVLTVYEHCMEWEIFDSDPAKFPFAKKIDYKDPDLRPGGMDWKDYTTKPIKDIVEIHRMTLLELVSILISKGYLMRNYHIENGVRTLM